MPLIWIIDVGWITKGETSWTLNAQNQDEYSIDAELASPLTQGHLSMTWVQTLNGSNNNFSEFKLEFSDFHILVNVGTNGSDDPLEISSGVTNSTVEEIEMVDWFNLSNNTICHSLEESRFTCAIVDRE